MSFHASGQQASSAPTVVLKYAIPRLKNAYLRRHVPAEVSSRKIAIWMVKHSQYGKSLMVRFANGKAREGSSLRPSDLTSNIKKQWFQRVPAAVRYKQLQTWLWPAMLPNSCPSARHRSPRNVEEQI
jgi:hypothetical protein